VARQCAGAARKATPQGDEHRAQINPQAKFKAAQAKAAKVGVENLSKEDVDGLNLAQLKELMTQTGH
jgi:hypothetical protein